MKTTRRSRLWVLSLLGATALWSLTALGCAGNPRVSVGGGIHRSGGSWGHSLSVGIHSSGRR